MLRKLSPQEEKLLELLINRVFPANSANIARDWKSNLLVEPMDDGGMGSLLLFPANTDVSDRKFGGQISEYQFQDSDGVTVSATLNIDQNRNLFELDIWKVDFSVLLRHFDPKDIE